MPRRAAIKEEDIERAKALIQAAMDDAAVWRAVGRTPPASGAAG